MRVRRTLRPGTAWAAAAALIVAPLVVAPIVSAAEPGSEEASSSAPAAAALSAPAAEQAPAEDEAPASEAAASSEAPAPAADTSTTERSASASASAAAPSSQAPASQAPAPSTQAAAPSSAAPQAKSLTSAPAAKPLESDSSDSGVSLLSANATTASLKVQVYRLRAGTGTHDLSEFASAGIALKLVTAASDHGAGTDIAGATCTTDSTGSCTIDILKTASGARFSTSGSTKDYWNGSGLRVEFASPSAARVATFTTFNSVNNTTSVQNSVFIAQDKARANVKLNTTAVAATIASTSRGPVVTDSNPTVTGRCNLRIGLAVDTSYSINKDEMTALKKAANGFVSTLSGTATHLGLWSFDTQAVLKKAPAAMNSDTQAAALTTAINGLPANPSSGSIVYTNWDDALGDMKDYSVANASAFDVVLLLTDGVPTAYRSGSSNPNSLTGNLPITRAVAQANSLKAMGTKVVVVAVGSVGTGNIAGVAGSNTSTTGGVLADSYSATNFETLADTLEQLANANCASTFTLQKKLVDGSDVTHLKDAKFTVQVDSTSTNQTTDANGEFTQTVQMNGASSKVLTITETDLQGRTIALQDGALAKCTLQGGASVVATKVSDTSFKVTVPSDKGVTCVVHNNPAPKYTSLTITHAWVDENGAAIPAADLSDIVASDGNPALKVNTGTAAAATYGATVSTWSGSALKAGDTATVTVGTAPSLKSAYTGSCTVQSVAIVPSGATALVAAAANNAFLVTHTLKCTTQLTLKKVVQAGPGDTTPASAWTLRSNGIAFTQGAAKAVQPGVAQELSEADGPVAVPNKAWERTNLVCDVAGTLNGTTVKVPRGKSVTCTFTNSSLQIEVSKRAWLGNTIPGSLSGDLPSGSAVADGSGISWLFTVKNTGFLDYRVSGISDNYVTTPITCAQSLTGTFKPFSSLTQSERTIANGSSLYCKATGTLAF